jgi:hypothetical protein
MSDTPTRRKPPPRLNRALAAHQRRARIIAQLQAQAVATANGPAAQRKTIRASTAKEAGPGKAEAWFCAGAFLLALGGIVAAGCVLAAMVSWQ